MSISMESNVQAANIRNIISKTAEAVAVINILSDIKHHEYAREWTNKAYSKMSPQSLSMLELISALPYQGIEFYEIVLDTKVFDDVKVLCKKIMEYDDIKFIYALTGEMIDVDKIKKIRNDRNEFENFIHELLWVYRGIKEIYEWIIFRTDDFKSNFVNLLLEIDNDAFEEKILSLNKCYDEAVKDMNSKLNKHSVSEVANEVMNNTVEEDNGIDEYIFIPSYFINPHYVMAFNKSSRLFLYDIRKKAAVEREEKAEKLSVSLKILSDKTRLEILRLLILQPCSGKILSSRLRLTTATISHHIDLLRSINLIDETRDKNTKYYSVNASEVDRLIKKLHNFLYND